MRKTKEYEINITHKEGTKCYYKCMYHLFLVDAYSRCLGINDGSINSFCINQSNIWVYLIGGNWKIITKYLLTKRLGNDNGILCFFFLFFHGTFHNMFQTLVPIPVQVPVGKKLSKTPMRGFRQKKTLQRVYDWVPFGPQSAPSSPTTVKLKNTN